MPPTLNKMREAIVEGNVPQALAFAEDALAEGIEANDIINRVVIPAMEIVGGKFECGDYFLPEMMAAAISTQSIMKRLKPLLAEGSEEAKAKAVVGTVKGDLHDIGKNLVAMMWEGAGFNVIDLGVDVTADKFVAAIREHNADLVGMSALLTTTMPMMSTIIKAIEEAGIRDKVKIMVGGAGITQTFVDQIGADGYAPDASSAVRKAKELLTH